MNLVKSLTWDDELLERGLAMCLNLGGHLAHNTLFGPNSYLLLHAIQYELTGDQFPCGMDGGMCETMN